MGPTARGDAGLPRSRRPTTLAGATSPGPAFLPERHRNPGYVVPPQPARAGYSGPVPSRVARHPALHPPLPPLRRSRRPLLAGDLGRGGPRLRDPRGSVSEDRVPETTRFRALPTCLPLRRRPMSLPASPATRLGRLPGSQPSPVTLGAPSGPYGAASSEIGGRSN